MHLQVHLCAFCSKTGFAYGTWCFGGQFLRMKSFLFQSNVCMWEKRYDSQLSSSEHTLGAIWVFFVWLVFLVFLFVCLFFKKLLFFPIYSVSPKSGIILLQWVKLTNGSFQANWECSSKNNKPSHCRALLSSTERLCLQVWKEAGVLCKCPVITAKFSVALWG